VRVLKVARIVVLGHAQCGGVQAMIEGAPREARDFVGPWMAMAAPVLKGIGPGADPAETLRHCETEVVRLSLRNLKTFPWIAEAEAVGRLTLHGLRFDIHTGVLATLTEAGFVPVE